MLSECDPGYFGIDCKQRCSQKCFSGICYTADGTCTKGCEAGYMGNFCDHGMSYFVFIKQMFVKTLRFASKYINYLNRRNGTL